MKIVVPQTNANQNNKSLQICRHGDRNRYAQYLNDALKNEKFWPGGYAQLTKIGMQQHYELGKFLRSRYNKLLGYGDYSADKVYVYSTVRSRKTVVNNNL